MLKELDKNSILLLGEPETGKEYLAKELTKGDLIYVGIDKSPKEVRDIFKPKFIVDCYTERLGVKSSEKYHISYAYDLDEIIRNIFMAREETGKDTTVIIDSLSPLIVTLGLVPVYRFLQRLFAIGREKNTRIILLLHKGMHKDEAEVSIRHLVDASLFLERGIEMGEETFYVDFGKLYSGKHKRIKYHIDKDKIIFDRFTI
ncbi:MAG: hypothetical protein APG12_01337 [Candidatus Methanofastidiosum methylothiophilum]|uniref:Flagellar accessory protein FlaH n=1 Tax=Candidatus Methanofastidiosum methylothiophilum TaxID=1705564 RepID=A0A150IXJ8_9EURY|nr:MAG: hypothetical protein APG10_01823 [Candidatus Methanofastidiosum methylthiophilus]KYC46739.1 MAG: hypothetical protein APG11_01715 [Candidatus Methanofastidiosum methylthiophilus]KYC49625.1 MAG: hypothetical protein APG12_01337 [Candidatus Methanofastidiosum methylthiophilus]